MRYVVSHNRNRDSYQVALAVSESKKLGRLVTDIYVDPTSVLSLSPRLATRWIDGLPRCMVSNCWLAFLAQLLLFVKFIPRRQVYSFAERAISRKAGRIASQHGYGLLAYSDHADLAFRKMRTQDGPKILFMYHPHYALIERVLQEDQHKWPSLMMRPEFELLYDESERRAADTQIREADFIICASSFTRRSLLNAGVNEDKIEVVPYGVELPSLIKNKETIDAEIRFLFVGQGRQRKGLHLLFEAWRALNLIGATLTCVCYSLDPVIAERCPPGVNICSKLSKAELTAAYRESHVFVMPSLIEGFGLVYLEALSNGCFVIGTDNTGLPDLEAPDWAAECVDAGDVNLLASALKSAYERAIDNRIDRNAIQEYARDFTWGRFRKRVNQAISSYEAAWQERTGDV